MKDEEIKGVIVIVVRVRISRQIVPMVPGVRATKVVPDVPIVPIVPDVAGSPAVQKPAPDSIRGSRVQGFKVKLATNIGGSKRSSRSNKGTVPKVPDVPIVPVVRGEEAVQRRQKNSFNRSRCSIFDTRFALLRMSGKTDPARQGS
jgi:hypothetical protein